MEHAQREHQQYGRDDDCVDCVCGITNESAEAQQYCGLWLQCDECCAWLHGGCVGYPKRPPKGGAPYLYVPDTSMAADLLCLLCLH